MIAPIGLVKIADDARHRGMVVMILVGGKAADNEIAAAKGTEPVATRRAEQFFIVEELSLEDESRRFFEGSQNDSRIGGTDDGEFVIAHGAAAPIANAALEDFPRRVELLRLVETLA